MKLNDKLTIACSFSLNSDSYDSLFILYQPIVSSAINLYLSLYSLLDKSKRTRNLSLSFITDLLNCNLKDFVERKDKLEAIGLLKTYQNKDEYIITLKLPLSVKEFFMDCFFGSLLEETIGEENFINIKKMFSIGEVNKNLYFDITKSFDDVFKIDNKKTDNKSTNNFYPNDKKNKGAIVKTKNFDINLVLKEYEQFLPTDEFLLKELKDSIVKQAFLYNMKETEIMEILDDIKNVSKILDVKTFIAASKNKYLENNNNKIKEKKDFSGFVKALEEATLFDIFYMYLKREPLLNETEVINKLMAEFDLSNSYVNYLVLYILKKKQQLPSYNYLKKVIEDWFEKGLYETLSVIEYLTSEKSLETNNIYNNQVKRKSKKKLEDEDWLKNVIDSFK